MLNVVSILYVVCVHTHRHQPCMCIPCSYSISPNEFLVRNFHAIDCYQYVTYGILNIPVDRNTNELKMICLLFCVRDAHVQQHIAKPHQLLKMVYKSICILYCRLYCRLFERINTIHTTKIERRDISRMCDVHWV